ncbi:MAG: hypothetical protein LUC95_11890 [Lachnospiraceae bacterium]|nr:hypothetical protein [Lachnospiraceae bacterium]MCD8380988.1 hypothetical protein [Lachnospiraceae bacterium]
MTYMKEDIIRLIDQAFTDYAANEIFQHELPLTDPSDAERLQGLLKNPDTLQALLILFNASVFSSTGKTSSSLPLLQTADQYPLSYLSLSSRTTNALSHCQGLRTVGDLLRMTDADITHIRGIGSGSRAMEEIRISRMKFIRDFQNELIR